MSQPPITAAEYLQRERKASFKSQFYRGEMFAMPGANRQHCLIVINVVSELGNQLRDRECEVYPSDMRVKVSPTGLYTYPDVSVACKEPQFEDDFNDVLINPQVIVEVLSDSTEAYDRGKKFEQYRQIASLRNYLLVAQKRVFVEHYSLQPTGGWLLTESSDVDQAIFLESIQCQLRVGDLYRKVSFELEDVTAPLEG